MLIIYTMQEYFVQRDGFEQVDVKGVLCLVRGTLDRYEPTINYLCKFQCKYFKSLHAFGDFNMRT
jgi:hypothetical protein